MAQIECKIVLIAISFDYLFCTYNTFWLRNNKKNQLLGCTRVDSKMNMIRYAPNLLKLEAHMLCNAYHVIRMSHKLLALSSLLSTSSTQDNIST